MSDPSELATAALGGLGGGGGLVALVGWLLKRGGDATEKLEATAALKLDQVLEKVSKLELSLAQFAEKHSSLGGEVNGLRERINGGLEDHSKRIVKLEDIVTRLDERGRRRGAK
jgi:hypothetical protein